VGIETPQLLLSLQAFMKNKTQTLDDSIRAEAYLLSEKSGHPPGMSEFFWFKAEALVLGKAGSNGRHDSSKNGQKKTMPGKEPKRSQAMATPSGNGKKARNGRVPATK
jgi:hypothetical protein